MKREPVGELSSTRRPPPCSATMRAAMARPRPVPRSLVEKWGRKSLSLSCGEMPWPVSATIISTKSESGLERVETVMLRTGEDSRDSAALSIKLTMTERRVGADGGRLDGERSIEGDALKAIGKDLDGFTDDAVDVGGFEFSGGEAD